MNAETNTAPIAPVAAAPAAAAAPVAAKPAVSVNTNFNAAPGANKNRSFKNKKGAAPVQTQAPKL